MVFAAGQGQRLRPLTEKLPKALVLVAGRPMIEYPLLLLRHYGVREIIINLHYLGEKIEEYLQDGEKLGLKIIYSREERLLDTGGGLLQAKSFLEDDSFIVINSDVIIDLPLAALLAEHQRHSATATLVLRPDPDADRYGAIEISDNLRIQKFLAHKGPTSGAAGTLTKLMFTGVQILEPRIFEYLQQETTAAFGITRTTYPRMLIHGETLYGFPFEGYCQDLGTIERIQEAEEKLVKGEVELHYLGKEPNITKR